MAVRGLYPVNRSDAPRAPIAQRREDSELPLDTIAAALNHLGWQSQDGTPIDGYDLYWLPAVDVLGNVSTTHPDRSQRWQISVEAAELARAALQTPH